jgi:hypothetical protein
MACVGQQCALRPQTLPTLLLEEAYHIGTLNPADKGKFSYEGHGLSISLDPERWSWIAELGGNPWWRLSRQGARFLDFWEISDYRKKVITRWGIERGLCTRQICYGFDSYDDELEDTMRWSYDTKAQATEEASEGYGMDEGAVYRTTTLMATEALSCALGGLRTGADCFDHLLVLWVEANTDLDGVWWEDTDGPMSCARGVIFPSKLISWQRKELSR